MEKEIRYLKLPNAEQGGAMVLIKVDDILTMETPTESTLDDDMTGEAFDIDVNKHTLIYVKSYKTSGNYAYYIPLSLKEMIMLVNSNAAYISKI